MGLGATLNRIRRRVIVELFDLEKVPEPAPPRAEWNTDASDPTESDDAETRLRVLSLNAWGLPVAPKCTERAYEIANAIDSGFEVVVLQEIWHRRERDIIVGRAQKAGFHFYHYFQPAVGFPVPLGSEAFGTGLLVLSKFPITYAMFHAFSLSGRPYALHESDFVANKGVGLLRLQVPGDREVDLYVTHLIANYNDLGKPGPGDQYIAHRVGQSYELERFIEATARNDLTLVCGDFNSPSDCMVLRIPRDLYQLRDAFTDMNNHDGLTFAAEDNKFSHGEHPMRMDYVLYKIAPEKPSDAKQATWKLLGSEIFKGFFTDKNGEKFPLSDHFGVTAEFVLSSQPRQLKPCDSMEANASDAATCDTTTCVNCDDVKASVTDSLDKLNDAVQCLKDVQQSLYEGRVDATIRRSEHLRRCATSLLIAIALLAIHLFVFSLTNWVWLGAALLVFHSVFEYVLAFFLVTLECSTFTELATEARLHLHTVQVRATKAKASRGEMTK